MQTHVFHYCANVVNNNLKLPDGETRLLFRFHKILIRKDVHTLPMGSDNCGFVPLAEKQ